MSPEVVNAAFSVLETIKAERKVSHRTLLTIDQTLEAVKPFTLPKINLLPDIEEH